MRQRKKIEKITLVAVILVLLAIPLYLLIHQSNKPEYVASVASYVGKDACIQCHKTAYEDWLGSHHDKAMDHANDSTVLGNFEDQTLEYQGKIHRMFKKDGRFLVHTDGEHGRMETFEIKYVFGFYPLQQYLVEFDGGRLQTLPLTWNSKDSVWYHMAEAVYPDELIEHGNWLHWTNQAQNWNSMCADCHSTNLVKGYDVATDTYNTTWSEIDVSCEACHGPASKHLEWAAKAEYARDTAGNFGLLVKTSGIDNKEYVDRCMRCHSRRMSFDDFHHEADVYHHSVPNLPMPENYHIDGQILEEDYVYGSFTQSKMYMNGVKCNDCHNVHSGQLLYDDNRLCTQCHRADDYDTYAHHFHKASGELGHAVVATDGVKFEVGAGTRCVNCHMPAQFYMGVDYRNDHSMRIPRPDLTKTLGTPNACNQCHSDQSVDWAITHVETWHGKGRPYQYGLAFDEATSGSQKGYEDLMRIYSDPVYPEMVRATALHYLGTYYPEQSHATLLAALGVSNGHIRYNALNLLMPVDEAALNALYNLLVDPAKAMRMTSANKLAALGVENVPPAHKEAFQKAYAEYLETLKYNADFPSGKFNLGNYYYNNNNLEKAEEFYVKALQQDSLLHQIKVNLAILYTLQKQPQKAEKMFLDYLAFYPEDGQTLFRYALFLSEQTRYDESMEYLLKAAKYAPENARLMYNIAMMYEFKNNPHKTEEYLKRALQLTAETPDYYIALLEHYLKRQETQKAKQLAKQVLEKFPDIQYKAQLQQLVMGE